MRIEQKWIDQNLAWNQSDHDGIRGIRLPSHRIWLPDSYIYNAAFDISSQSPTQGVVNGMIEFRFICIILLKNYRSICYGLSYR